MVFAHLTAHNTGASDDNLNCGLFTDNTRSAAAAWPNVPQRRRPGVVGAISTTIASASGAGASTGDVTLKLRESAGATA